MTLFLAITVSLTQTQPSAGKPTSTQDPKNTGFITKTFKNADESESQYWVFVPHDYDGKKEYPVILFLHGAGATKSDRIKPPKLPIEYGIATAIKEQEKTFPFIVVIPRAEAPARLAYTTWRADSPNAKRALAILDEVMQAYKTDSKRVYLTGLSMGGGGTWSLAAAHPERWAAIVPICGQGDTKTAEKFKDIPCWCFHGDKDESIKVEASREMIAALKKTGGSPKYTEYPGIGHNSWDKTYATKELWTWLMEQKRK
jgi:predicted peptidase